MSKIDKKFILDTFVNFVKENKRSPTEAELQNRGVTRNAVRWHFNTVKELKLQARDKNPEVFKNIIDESTFTKKNFDRLEKLTHKYKKFVITTAVAGCSVHHKFYKALKHYCKKNDALFMVIPVKDPAASVVSNSSWEIDPIFAENNDTIVFGDLALNKNLYISGIKVSAKQIDPTTGLDRLAHDCSFIFGSPKWRMRMLPNAKNRHSHMLISTGAVTLPNYHTENYMSQRTAYLADYDHKLSALIVELDEGEIFHVRHLTAEPATGNFVDLSDYYKPSGSIAKLNPVLLSMGDTHAGQHDPVVMNAWKEVVDLTKPDYTIQHDLFNGQSINHHGWDRAVSRAKLAIKGDNSLEEELKTTAEVLKEVSSWTKKGAVVVKSNHDEWLMQYLESGKFVKDPINFFTATELINKVKEGEDPLAAGVGKFLTEKEKEKVMWLAMDEEFNIAGIECGAHGHKGPNGSRGTLNSLEKAYGGCIIGHSHAAGILRDAWQNGTSTLKDLGYNSGASSWSHSSTLLYPNGARQMIHVIKGKWRKAPKRERKSPKRGKKK